jgi:hypothetical protein
MLKILLAAVPVAITGVVIPWLNAHTTAQQKAEITRVVSSFVQTAEQLFGPGTGPQKLEAVKRWLTEKGLEIDDSEIEAAVLRLHAAGHDWLSAHSQDSSLVLPDSQIDIK